MKVLFVCFGNLCRSVIAEAILKSKGHEAKSAGISTTPRLSTPLQVFRALQKLGIVRAKRKPEALTPEMIEWADIIVATSDVFDFVKQKCCKKILCWNVPDPWGRDQEEYDNVAFLLERLVTDFLKKYNNTF